METKTKDCCSISNNKDKKGFLAGLLYGLVPHAGCIAFILFSVLGVTAASAFFKKLLLNPYFFYILIGLSIVFATISASIYLKRCDLLSSSGIKKKWKYLTILYGTTILVNLLMFTVVFPYTANLTPTGLAASSGNAQITLEVAIPCPGHASLITDELKKLEGISNVKFEFPNQFIVDYDSSKLTKEKILSLEVFKTYSAKEVK